MKSKKMAFLVLFVAGLLTLAFYSGLKSSVGDILYVNVKEGLDVRNKPDLGAPKLRTIPFAEKVKVLDVNGIEDTIDDIHGRWIKIKWMTLVYSTVTGWVFEPYLTSDNTDYINKDFSDIKEAPRLDINNQEYIYAGKSDNVGILLQKINEESFDRFDFNVYLLDINSKELTYFNTIPGYNEIRKPIISKNNYRYENGNLIYVTYYRLDTGSQKEEAMYSEWQESLAITGKIPNNWNIKDGFAGEINNTLLGNSHYNSKECFVSPKNYFVVYTRESTEFEMKYLRYSDTEVKWKALSNERLGDIEIEFISDLKISTLDGDNLIYYLWGKREYNNNIYYDNYGYVYDKANTIKTVYSLGFDRNQKQKDIIIIDMSNLKIKIDRMIINPDNGMMVYEMQKDGNYELHIKNIITADDKIISRSLKSFGKFEWKSDNNTLLFNGKKSSYKLKTENT